MKAKLRGKINSVDKSNGVATLSITADGKVERAGLASQETSFGGVLKLRGLVADQMKIGAVLTITVSDEETPLE